MPPETETPETKIEPTPETPKPAAKAAAPVVDKASEDAAAAAAADKVAAAEERKRAREIETAAAKAVAEYKEKADKEAAEVAELAKKSDAERAAAEKKKLEDKLASAVAEAADNKLAADLALELIEQGLAPASTKARDHITAAFRAHVKAGKDAADALKAVHAEEGYLFKGPAPVVETPAVVKPAQTQPSNKGPTVVAAPTAGDEKKKPGDIKDPVEFKKALKEQYGITLSA